MHYLVEHAGEFNLAQYKHISNKHHQTSSIIQSIKSNSIRKKGEFIKDSKDETLVDVTKKCRICDKGDHSTLDCPELPAATLALKA